MIFFFFPSFKFSRFDLLVCSSRAYLDGTAEQLVLELGVHTVSVCNVLKERQGWGQGSHLKNFIFTEH